MRSKRNKDTELTLTEPKNDNNQCVQGSWEPLISLHFLLRTMLGVQHITQFCFLELPFITINITILPLAPKCKTLW